MAPRVIAAIRHSAAVAALLSFLWPGLGQDQVGSRRRAPMFAVPMMLYLGAGLLVMIVQGKARAFGLLLQPSVLLLLLVRSAFSGEPGATATPRHSSSATPAPGSGSIC